MRKIVTTTFITLDGVMQAPDGPEEDISNGFKYGRWQFNGNDDGAADKILDEFMSTPYDLLLGSLTYKIWIGYWPQHKDEERFGKPFDIATKYVVSHNSIPLPWDNSVLITGDVVKEIKNLKNSDGPDLCVWGSGNLIQTLLKNNLIDQMHIWTYPITIGGGKKLFAEGTLPERFKMVNSQITPTGVIYAVYEPSEPLKIG